MENKNKGSRISAEGKQSWQVLARAPKENRIQSVQARKRRQMQSLKWVFGISAILGITLLVTLKWNEYKQSNPIRTHSNTVKKILFRSDGVLSCQWLGSEIRIPKDTALMEIDIYAIKQKLDSIGQVQFATVEREFPDRLNIKIKERVPILRINLANSRGHFENRIVARDGTIYKGIGYSEPTLKRLPYLIPYPHTGTAIQPVRGIETVAQLMEITSETQSWFFESWKVVDLSNYSGDNDLPGQVIKVNTSLIPSIIFGTNKNFDQQLGRLGMILSYLQGQNYLNVQRIDLSTEDDAIVQFKSGHPHIFQR